MSDYFPSYSDTISQQLLGKSEEFIFIIGPARSGTTLLFSYLSESPDVFLLNEDSPHHPDSGSYFVERYNKQWQNMRHVRSKGYFIPPFCANHYAWFDVYLSLKRHYKFVGSKQAFGPHGDLYWEYHDKYHLQFFSRNFLFSQYVLPIRNPWETIFSMKKLFSGVPFGTHKNAWIKSLQFQLEIMGCMPHSRFFFHHRSNISTLKALAIGLGISPADKSEGYVTPHSERDSYIDIEDGVKLALSATELHELEQMRKAYEFLCANFDEETGLVRLSVETHESIRSLVAELEKIRTAPASTFSL